MKITPSETQELFATIFLPLRHMRWIWPDFLAEVNRRLDFHYFPDRAPIDVWDFIKLGKEANWIHGDDDSPPGLRVDPTRSTIPDLSDFNPFAEDEHDNLSMMDAIRLTDFFHRTYDATCREVENDGTILKDLADKGYLEPLSVHGEESLDAIIRLRDEAIKALIAFNYEGAAALVREITSETTLHQSYRMTPRGMNLMREALGEKVLQ